jgi:16S rRNA (uracil1498-N3)-methyltransferase
LIAEVFQGKLPLSSMEVPYFFHESASPGVAVNLDETNSRHALQVLRMQPGDLLQLTNGQGVLWSGTISGTGKKACIVAIEKEEKLPRSVFRKSAVGISPLKNTGRFEWFLEKATELGIAEIFPLLCHRTVREKFRHDRMRQICISAMLQSRQVWLPMLHEPQPYTGFVGSQSAHAYHHRWIAHCEGYEKHLLTSVLQPGMHDSLLLIGPEGDFTTEEIFAATDAGYVAVSLGQTRLRTETAGVVGAALLCLG